MVLSNDLLDYSPVFIELLLSTFSITEIPRFNPEKPGLMSRKILDNTAVAVKTRIS